MIVFNKGLSPIIFMENNEKKYLGPQQTMEIQSKETIQFLKDHTNGQIDLLETNQKLLDENTSLLNEKIAALTSELEEANEKIAALTSELEAKKKGKGKENESVS